MRRTIIYHHDFVTAVAAPSIASAAACCDREHARRRRREPSTLYAFCAPAKPRRMLPRQLSSQMMSGGWSARRGRRRQRRPIGAATICRRPRRFLRADEQALPARHHADISPRDATVGGANRLSGTLPASLDDWPNSRARAALRAGCRYRARLMPIVSSSLIQCLDAGKHLLQRRYAIIRHRTT